MDSIIGEGPKGESFAFLKLENSAAGAAVINVKSSMEMFATTQQEKPKVLPGSKSKGYVLWGGEDNLPQSIMAKVAKSPDVARYMAFNIACGMGDSIMAVRKKVVDNKRVFIPVYDNLDINTFLVDNDIDAWLENQLTDLNYFGISFCEFILSQEEAQARRIIELNHLDACFSRWETQNVESGNIDNMFYSAKFFTKEAIKDTDYLTIKALNRKNPALDIQRRIGRVPDRMAKLKDEKVLWWSIFESGWFDFALLIPALKKALLNNQMTIKYVVRISEAYFPALFLEEGITDKQKKSDRIKLEYKNIQDFLAGVENTGKALITSIKYTVDGKEQPMITILPIENHFKGGEYIEDSEEVSNVMAKGMGVHASIVGSNGKSGTINGTEARELFIITESLMSPIRKRVLRPLYVVKAVNKWPEDIDFIIPNMELTTLDKNPTGKVTKAGGETV